MSSNNRKKAATDTSKFHAATLQRHYAASCHDEPGLLLFVKANHKCCFEGGVISLLGLRNTSGSSIAAMTSMSGGLLGGSLHQLSASFHGGAPGAGSMHSGGGRRPSHTSLQSGGSHRRLSRHNSHQSLSQLAAREEAAKKERDASIPSVIDGLLHDPEEQDETPHQTESSQAAEKEATDDGAKSAVVQPSSDDHEEISNDEAGDEDEGADVPTDRKEESTKDQTDGEKRDSPTDKDAPTADDTGQDNETDQFQEGDASGDNSEPTNDDDILEDGGENDGQDDDETDQFQEGDASGDNGKPTNDDDDILEDGGENDGDDDDDDLSDDSGGRGGIPLPPSLTGNSNNTLGGFDTAHSRTPSTATCVIPEDEEVSCDDLSIATDTPGTTLTVDILPNNSFAGNKKRASWSPAFGNPAPSSASVTSQTSATTSSSAPPWNESFRTRFGGSLRNSFRSLERGVLQWGLRSSAAAAANANLDASLKSSASSVRGAGLDQSGMSQSLLTSETKKRTYTDLFCVGLYSRTLVESENENDPAYRETLLCMTESQPLPVPQACDTEHSMTEGTSPSPEDCLCFGLPLRIPHREIVAALEPTNNESGTDTEGEPSDLVVKLWIRNESGWLATSHFLVGSGKLPPLRYLLRQRQDPKQFANNVPTVLQIHLESQFVEGGMLSLCAVTPPILATQRGKNCLPRGWSLADPRRSRLALSSRKNMWSYHPILLQQIYCISDAWRAPGLGLSPVDENPFHDHSSSSRGSISSFHTTSFDSHWIATERAVESTVVVPLAAAWAQLTSRACRESLVHTETMAQYLKYKQHSRSSVQDLVQQQEKLCQQLGPEEAPLPEYADCSVGVGSIRLAPAAEEISLGISNSTMYVSVSWQPPDSVFEVAIIEPTAIPLVESSTNLKEDQFAPTAEGQFFPKPRRTDILPSLLRAMGGTLPAAGFMLGSLRLVIVVVDESSGNGRNGRTGGWGRSRKQLTQPQKESRTQAAISAALMSSKYWRCTIGLDAVVLQAMIQNQVGGGMMMTADAGLNGNSNLNTNPNHINTPVKEYPVFNQDGQEMAKVSVAVAVNVLNQLSLDEANQSISIADFLEENPNPFLVTHSAQDGLVSLTGMDSGTGIYHPFVDFSCSSTTDDSDVVDTEESQRITLGDWMTHSYLQQHITTIRERDTGLLIERSAHYLEALQNLQLKQSGDIDSDDEADEDGLPMVPPLFLDRNPRPFRPDGTQSDELLNALPINLHLTSLNFRVVQLDEANKKLATSVAMSLAFESPEDEDEVVLPAGAIRDDVLLTHTTSGAPADHGRGFGNVFDIAPGPNSSEQTDSSPSTPTRKTNGKVSSDSAAPTTVLPSPVGAADGGLRRLEAKRLELCNLVHGLYEHLTLAVDIFLSHAKKSPGNKARKGGIVNHVPATQRDVQGIRQRAVEAVQALHHVTWACAMRRVNVFSQVLGIAVSTYLMAVSSNTTENCNGKASANGNTRRRASPWPDYWVRHGFLLCVEGLMSMLSSSTAEDSSDGGEVGMFEDASVGIQMLKMATVVLVNGSGGDGATKDRIRHSDRVDIPYSPHLRWICIQTSGNHARREFVVKVGVEPEYFESRIQSTALGQEAPVRFYPVLLAADLSRVAREAESPTAGTQQAAGGQDASESERASKRLFDKLNKEAFDGLNWYASLINPPSSHRPMSPEETHPLLETLFYDIKKSQKLSGNGSGIVVNEVVLMAAEDIVQQLGGGMAVFCKTGKETTALYTTLKQAQVCHSHRLQHHQHASAETAAPFEDPQGLGDANFFREFGTKRVICEKNTGEPLFSLTPRQVEGLPETLRPPKMTVRAQASFFGGS